MAPRVDECEGVHRRTIGVDGRRSTRRRSTRDADRRRAGRAAGGRRLTLCRPRDAREGAQDDDEGAQDARARR
jgi:hypothetical protein